MNERFVLIAIAVVAAVFILRPLWQARRPRADREVPPVTMPAPAESDELAELELDRAMGRIGEEDYARWRAELDLAAAPGAVPAHPALPDDARARAEALVRQWGEAPRPTCPTCGLRPEPEARFCSNCGSALTQG